VTLIIPTDLKTHSVSRLARIIFFFFRKKIYSNLRSNYWFLLNTFNFSFATAYFSKLTVSSLHTPLQHHKLHTTFVQTQKNLKVGKALPFKTRGRGREKNPTK